MPRIGSKSLLLAVLLAFASPVAVSQSAAGYGLFPCEFGGTNIYWRPYSLTGRVNTAAGVATGAWNNKATPVNLIYSSTSADPHISVMDSVYGQGWWGLMSPPDDDLGCSDTGGIWDSSEVAIQIDTSETADLTSYQLNLVVMHEFGHAQGLAHSGSTCVASNTNKKVMSQGTDKFNCTGTAPWADDEAGINSKYN